MSQLRPAPSEITDFRRCGEPAARCPLRAVTDAGGLHCLGIASRDAAADHLRTYVSRSRDIGTLRRLAGQDDVMAAQLSDEQIVAQVAVMVERREVCLLATVLERTVGFTVKKEAQRAEPVPRVATGQTPSRIQPRAAEPPAAAAAPPIDSLDRVDAAQQVGVLEEAARNGVPFCEMCGDAKREPA